MGLKSEKGRRERYISLLLPESSNWPIVVSNSLAPRYSGGDYSSERRGEAVLAAIAATDDYHIFISEDELHPTRLNTVEIKPNTDNYHALSPHLFNLLVKQMQIVRHAISDDNDDLHRLSPPGNFL